MYIYRLVTAWLLEDNNCLQNLQTEGGTTLELYQKIFGLVRRYYFKTMMNSDNEIDFVPLTLDRFFDSIKIMRHVKSTYIMA